MSDTAIFALTACVVVAWSVWNYLYWIDKAGISESSPMRLLAIGGPSVWFILVVLVGGGGATGNRLDLVGLGILNGVIFLAAVFLVFALLLFKNHLAPAYRWIFGIYSVLSIATVVILFVFKNNPVLFMRVALQLRTWVRFDFLSFEWLSLDPSQEKRDIFTVLDKVLIAVISYIPVGIIRFISRTRQRSRLMREIELLKKRVKKLEQKNSS